MIKSLHEPANLIDDTRISFFGVSNDPADEKREATQARVPGIRFFWDNSREVAKLYDVAERLGNSNGATPVTFLLDPFLRVLGILSGLSPANHAKALMSAVIALPTPTSARIARNTQLILQHETGITKVVDPLAGSYYVESLTASLIAEARKLIGEVEALGGMTKAVASGMPKLAIEESAARRQAAVDRGEETLLDPYGAEDRVEFLAVAAEHFAVEAATLREVMFTAPLILSGDTELHVVLKPRGDDLYDFTVATQSPPGPGRRSWREHARGELLLRVEPAPALLSLAELRDQCPTAVPRSQLQEYLQSVQLDLGPQWLWTQELYSGARAALARMAPPTADAQPEGLLHPALLDSAFSSVAAALFQSLGTAAPVAVIPWMVRELRVYGAAPGPLWCHSRVEPAATAAEETGTADLTVFEPGGRVRAVITGLVVKRAQREAFFRQEERLRPSWLYQVAWRAVAPVAP